MNFSVFKLSSLCFMSVCEQQYVATARLQKVTSALHLANDTAVHATSSGEYSSQNGNL